MKIPIYQVDAFAEEPFTGNPAAVCPLNEWPEDSILQKIAAENNLSETAFFVKSGKEFHLRWFTPVLEIDLCGHATMATAHVLFNHLDYQAGTIHFNTLSGLLKVSREGDLLSMDFPSWEPLTVEAPKELILGLGSTPESVLKTRDYIAVFKTESEVRNLDPDFHLLSTLDVIGIIVTAPGDSFDFISRFFAPKAGVNEDPVTGSAHASLTPYWSKTLNKLKLSARQISTRGGNLLCEQKGDRVIIKGNAVTYMQGEIAYEL